MLAGKKSIARAGEYCDRLMGDVYEEEHGIHVHPEPFGAAGHAGLRAFISPLSRLMSKALLAEQGEDVYLALVVDGRQPDAGCLTAISLCVGTAGIFF